MTVKEIAKMCGVSPSTVSNAVNGKANISEETRKKILDCIQQMGYQPNYFAANIRKQSTKTIGIIAEDLGQFSTSDILESAMARCEEQGYRAVIMNLRMYDKWEDTWYHDDQKLQNVLEPILHEFQAIHVDGLIYIAGHGRTINCIPDNFAIPTVIAYGWADQNRFPSIVPDDVQGGYDMMKYLLSQGHKRIGILSGVADNLHAKARLLGYQRALFEAGIPFNPEWIYYGDWKKPTGALGAEELLKNDITAIVCMNDLMAGGVYDYAHEHDLVVGKDFSVVGYDNQLVTEYLYPRLTTCHLPLREIGCKASEMLIQNIIGTEKAESYEPIKLPCRIIYRDSVLNLNMNE
jgi:LacI family transcriptional regulator